MRILHPLIVLGWALLLPGLAAAQSQPDPELFDGAKVVKGVSINRETCARFEREQTAVWVEADGDAQCLRYYAFGLDPRRPNPRAVGWMQGDVVGGPESVRARHQEGLGVTSMIAQMRHLSERYGAPFVFIARPGAYGSSGKHEPTTSTRHEAALVQAQMDAISRSAAATGWANGSLQVIAAGAPWSPRC